MTAFKAVDPTVDAIEDVQVLSLASLRRLADLASSKLGG
jgi:hypothetical protein